ncbi:MAG: MBL fold metallo-hydrolase, partial [Nitrososphaeraceae archaeon]
MNNDVSMKSNPASSDLTSTSKTLVRMNGVMPDISTLGNSEKSERAAEVKRVNITANTSCSVLVSYGTTSSNMQVFHLLVDVGEGIIQSLEKTDLSSYHDFSSTTTKSSIGTAANIPDVILLTHSHNDHVKELPLVISKYSDQESKKLNVYCTKECHVQVINKFPELKSKTNGSGRIAFNTILPNEAFNVGPVSVIPISVYHGDN